MESASILESIAEVAIALAGFGGIAAGLGYRARGQWTSDDRVRLVGLAVFGLALVFACYLPTLAYHLGSDAPLRTASALFLAVPVGATLFQAGLNRHGIGAGYSRAVALAMLAAQLTAATLLAAAALGHAGGREFGFYLAAVLAMLLHASVVFVRLLFTSFRGEMLE